MNNSIDKKKAAAAKTPPWPHPLYAWLVVGILMLAYILSYVDRSILTLLVDPIKQDMGLSDLQISLLHGFAFAIFYSALGFPIGRIADVKNRVGVIAIGVTLWSLMTAACGIAKNFTHFFLARVGVGVGEASLNPAAYSIITDYFPKEKLSRAISTYVMGTYLGFGTAYIIGGTVVRAIGDRPDLVLPVVGTVYSWQLAFFIVALPGALIPLLLLFVKEPFRRGRLNKSSNAVQSIPLQQVAAFVRRNKTTFLCHATGYGLLGIMVNGMALWTPTFMVRSYGWNAADAGIAYGILLLVFGGSGVYCGGWLADVLQQRGRKTAALITACGCACLLVIPATLYPLMPSAKTALMVMAPMIFFSSAPWGIAVSAIQQFTPNELRGQISALMYLFPVNLIGIGFGPAIVAVLTDYAFADANDLRYSMAIVSMIASVLAAIVLRLGLKPFGRSLEAAEKWKDDT